MCKLIYTKSSFPSSTNFNKTDLFTDVIGDNFRLRVKCNAYREKLYDATMQR